MAHHVSEQKSYNNCKLLLEELERVVAEEMLSRKKLIAAGVRDVSHLIQLPPNTLDQLDEESAEYDDKRLCHACKHICFFSAVACECSQSKVSCLRHSHYMCRCPIERRYLMVWSPEEELHLTCRKVREHCEKLKAVDTSNGASTTVDADSIPATRGGKVNLPPLPPVAVGVEQDREAHKNDTINTEPYQPNLDIMSSFLPGPDDPVIIDNHQHLQTQQVTSDEDRDEATTADGAGMEKDDDEEEQ
jgi:C5HC2 zinc finger